MKKPYLCACKHKIIIMRKINQFITLAVVLVLMASRAAGQTYTYDVFNYELNEAGSETYAYITG